MARNVGEVVDRIKREIPEGHPAIASLDSLMREAVYKAPEQMREVWGDLGAVLHRELPDLEDNPPAWAIRVGKIVRGEE
jgi:hypothetical protein